VDYGDSDQRRFQKPLFMGRARQQRERSARVRNGLLGGWDFLTGKYAKVRMQNESEALLRYNGTVANGKDCCRTRWARRELRVRIEQERRPPILGAKWNHQMLFSRRVRNAGSS
jgi:hypothetical protein